MITILHGDDVLQSRDALQQFIEQQQGKEVVRLEGKSLDRTLLVQSLESHSLFENERVVVIENLLSSQRSPKQRTELAAYLKRGSFDADVLLWEGKPVGKYIISLKKQKSVQVREFKMPSIIFKLVDSLRPGSASVCLALLNETLANTVPEIVFTMLVRQFRLLLALSSHADIEETKRLAPWQAGKMRHQARLFTTEQLTNLYHELMLIDFRVKTGKTPLSLTKHLEQFMIKLASIRSSRSGLTSV
ncbi:MAG TPA: hypothetical protein VJL83_04400 [Patescibacteria group bacterium]|nr:hypothetical protein [Patescibacteria group bacterium]